jgi:hypothetical protein
MGFVPEHWGPHVWSAIHILAMGAPQHIDADTRKAYAQFYNALPHILPCAVCGHHLAENLITLPVEPHLNSRDDLFNWTVAMHNRVNQQTGKKQYSMEEAFEHWKSVCLGVEKDCKKSNKHSFKLKMFFGFSIVVIVLIVLYFIIRKRSKLK